MPALAPGLRQVLPLPLEQQRWAPCLGVGGRMSCQLRSGICSSL